LQLIKQKTATTNVRRIRRTVCIADVKRLFIYILALSFRLKSRLALLIVLLFGFYRRMKNRNAKSSKKFWPKTIAKSKRRKENWLVYF